MIDWCPFAVQADPPSPNFTPGHNPRRGVVLHISEGSFESGRNWLLNSVSRVSSHFLIGETGQALQLVSLADTAWTNGLNWDRATRKWMTVHKPYRFVVPTWDRILPGVDPNSYTVTVEVAGYHDRPLPIRQYNSLIRVLRWVSDQLLLAYDPHHTLIGHCEINPVEKPFCPGNAFDFAKIAREANTRWFPSPKKGVIKAPIEVLQEPKRGGHGTGVVYDSTKEVYFDALVRALDFTPFLHTADGLGFVLESDVSY